MNFTRWALSLTICIAAAAHVPAQSESSIAEPVALLKKLYKAHLAEKGPFSAPTNRALCEQYFTKELAGLIRADAIAAKGEIGAVDFDPFYDSQNPEITDLKIGQPDSNGIIKVTFKDSGEAKTLTFHLEQNAQKAWRITDITYPDGRTLAGILRSGAG